MKYDLNVHAEMGKNHIRGVQYVPAPSRHRGSLRPGFDVSGKISMFIVPGSPAVTYALILRCPRCCFPAELIIAA